MSTKPVVIQCATPPEFQALHQALGSPALEKAGRRQYFVAGDGTVVVLRGAVGKVWAAASAEFAIARWNPGLVVDFGAAGGLVHGLAVGDIVVAEKVVEHDVADTDGNRFLAPEGLAQTLVELESWLGAETWLTRVPSHPEFVTLPTGTRATRGRIASGDKDIQSLEERARMAADHDALAATWESGAVGRIARFHGIPYLSVRVITDVGSASRDEFLAEYRQGVATALPPAAAALTTLFRDQSRK